MDLDPDPLQRGIGGVLHGAGEGVGLRVVGDDQSGAPAGLVVGVVQSELLARLLFALRSVLTAAVLAVTFAPLVRLAATVNQNERERDEESGVDG